MKKTKKLVVVFICLAVLALAPYFVWNNLLPMPVGGGKILYSLDILLRASGLLVFFLLFLQIIFETFLDKWKKLLGNWIIGFQMILGIMAFSLILFHPISLFLTHFISMRIIDPFYIFTDFCLLCRTTPELYLSFGRVAFWLALVFGLAAALRSQAWWKENWKYLRLLSYPLFYFVSLHAWFLGKGVHLPPFLWVFVIVNVIVGLTVIYRILPNIKFKLK